MNESKHGEHLQGGPDIEIVHPDRLPYWKRAHHSWGFWVGLVLALAGIIIYFTSDNLSLMIHGRMHQPQSNAAGK